ncbi:MAG: hypothetical protein QOD99_2899 [Chthoniobacter sp.]|nr:hypothetical protein [Chthoniobacter sp.]
MAQIAVNKVIPAMQRSEWCDIAAIASRSLDKAREAADKLEIAKAYGSYEELLDDSEIEAIYIALPNHLHVAWAIRCAEAGKHVLCEKPIGLTVKEAQRLLEARDRTGVRIEEAFMVRHHPQWKGVLEIIESGGIGQVRSVMGVFSYNNRDPQNIRNIFEYGGGGLMDIGCYLIYAARLVFAGEPQKVIGLVEEDPVSRTDVLTSSLLQFASGQAVFTCSTKLGSYQRLQIAGTEGRIEIEIPFNAPPDQPCRVWLRDASNPPAIQTLEYGPCDQYTAQGDAFSRSVRERGAAAVPLEGSIRNMAVIEAILRSAKTGAWEIPQE